MLRQLSQMLDSMPVWLQFVIAVGLVAYSAAAVYGRIDPGFGAKVFSKIPEDEIQTNKSHILQYTVIPVAVTFGYLALLAVKYLG
jgi:hypothetical protein